MRYQQTLDWLFAQLPMYQRVGGANYKIDLEKTHQLMRLLGHPEKQFKSIHVAGTNGKGSVSHLVAAALQQKGLKVGLYTSPHLLDFRERVKINGEEISETAVIDFVEKYKSEFEQLQLSFFEMTVGLAFHHFAKQKVDIAVIEVGLGGRLDSTNIITPEVSVITNIGLDHTQFLGSTLAKIAAEKAGIIKKNVPVVIGKTQPETTEVFETVAQQMSAKLIFADQQKSIELDSDLRGIYQTENKRTAFVALQQLPKNLKPTEGEIRKGFLHAAKITGLRGRWQIAGQNPTVVCDTGHNAEGISILMEQINAQNFDRLHMVWGMVNDKNIDPIFSLLPKNATYYFAKANIPRSHEVDTLITAAKKAGLSAKGFKTVAEAFAAAHVAALPSDFIFVGGSTFVVADFLQHLENKGT